MSQTDLQHGKKVTRSRGKIFRFKNSGFSPSYVDLPHFFAPRFYDTERQLIISQRCLKVAAPLTKSNIVPYVSHSQIAWGRQQKLSNTIRHKLVTRRV